MLKFEGEDGATGDAEDTAAENTGAEAGDGGTSAGGPDAD